jgi:hypothetical protein
MICVNWPTISCVTRTTLRCTAIFLWNSCSQSLVLSSFGRSPEELLLEYQSDIFFMNISVENGVNRGQNLGISGNTSRNRQSHSKKILGQKTSETFIVKKSTFYLLTPLQFWGFFRTRLGVLSSPIWFFSRADHYWQKYKGESFVGL